MNEDQFPQLIRTPPRNLPKKRNTLKKILITVSILIILAIAGFFGINQYDKIYEDTYIEGAMAGYEEAIVQLLTLAVKCEQVPITYNNQTFNVILVECLQMQGVSE